MTEIEPKELPVIPPDAPICRHLRSKGMYVFTDAQEEEHDDDCDGSFYWCVHTMKTYGPDDRMVLRRECKNPSRSCYEPL